jgi:hypothetical protein
MRSFRANIFNLYFSHATSCLQQQKKHMTCIIFSQLTWFFSLWFCRFTHFEQRLQCQVVEVSTHFQITKYLNIVVLWLTLILGLVIWIWGFEGGLGPPTRGGLWNCTAAAISNHQTSKFSRFWSKTQDFLWVFWIWGFEGGLGPPTRGGPWNCTAALISNHQTPKFSGFWSKIQDFL